MQPSLEAQPVRIDLVVAAGAAGLVGFLLNHGKAWHTGNERVIPLQPLQGKGKSRQVQSAMDDGDNDQKDQEQQWLDDPNGQFKPAMDDVPTVEVGAA